MPQKSCCCQQQPQQLATDCSNQTCHNHHHHHEEEDEPEGNGDFLQGWLSGKKRNGSRRSDSDYASNSYAANSCTPELQAVWLLAILDSEFVCRICNELLIDCVCLACGHNFCGSCLHKWVSSSSADSKSTGNGSSGRFRCPTCSQTFSTKQFQQRTYCIDEFLTEVYTSLVAFAKAALGSKEFKDHQSLLMNLKSSEEREFMKAKRREICIGPKLLEQENINALSVLEFQRELSSLAEEWPSINLVVQLILSVLTAFIVYEIGDTLSCSWILIGLISVMVWYGTFLGVMRLLGYEGSVWEIMTEICFVRIEYVEPEPDAATTRTETVGN